MAERITDKLVRELELPAKGNRIVYDDRVSGFGIRITSGGSRSFVLNYRNSEGVERRLTIGPYGRNEWSVEAARKRAGDLKKNISNGGDPLAEKVEARGAASVAGLCDRYIDDHLPRKRPSSQRDDKAMITKIIRPKLGNQKVAGVTHLDIDKLHRAMKATPYRANRVLSLLSKMFALSIRYGWRPDNPCQGVERFHEEKRTRYLNTKEISRLVKVLADYPEIRAAKVEQKHKDPDAIRSRERVWGLKTANVVRLCLLTGCRVGEALNATWSQLDLEGDIWIKPGATTKQGTEHRAPLSGAAVLLVKDILAAAPKDEDDKPESPYVFPGRTPDQPLNNLKRDWGTIRKTAKIEDVRMHDLRHTYASILVSTGASLPLIGALLGHTQVATTARYAHLFDDPLRKAADEVGYIVTGKKSAEVVKLGKGGAA